jgi:MYXO-CTERM domain-containing protein
MIATTRSFLAITVCCGTFLGLTLPRPVAASPCAHSRVLIVLDKSSSMVRDNAADGQLKWNAAVNAVETLVQSYGDTIDFGLMVFPNPSQCSPGSINVDVGPNTAAEISAALATPPPVSGSYTPMAETLDVAVTYDRLLDPTQRNYVLLVTDGWQWCDPYEAATRFDAVTSVENLESFGIETFVLGFGASVDVLNNNRMAVAGGTSIAGCDPTVTSPSASNLCYFQTESQDQLETAFDNIAGTIVDETCDGVDNDCDGLVDNKAPGNAAPLTRNSETACGICVSECQSGVWSTCTVSGECDDGNACTTGDYCTNNACTGTPVSCDDGNPCTADSCDPDSGCRHAPVADGTPCANGDPCRTATCVGGVCTSGGEDICGGSAGGTPDGTETDTTGAGIDRGCGCRSGADAGPYAALTLVFLGFFRRRRV